MNDPRKPTATQGTDDTVMPSNVADVAETGQDANTTSENMDGDGQHKLKKEVDEATDLPQKGSA
ncbi:hypothetical protein REJC140_03444 [Pseudorhizobium endolithicum]|uniref:Uncharacterized protein n=1 Tax=Pseudorhizobium endolithicum TaxID=1191678 RepID=A0ABM8PL35_9HYPH|nr:hypothetical protein [Pseudorhizobium endolithicum]CAD7035722.1 hypothetical protein REJC140_03444 [Pseudorhizobium endolithicum]